MSLKQSIVFMLYRGSVQPSNILQPCCSQTAQHTTTLLHPPPSPKLALHPPTSTLKAHPLPLRQITAIFIAIHPMYGIVKCGLNCWLLQHGSRVHSVLGL